MKQYAELKEELRANYNTIDNLNDQIAGLENQIHQHLDSMQQAKEAVAHKEAQKKEVTTQLRQTKARLAMKEADFQKLQNRFDMERITGLPEDKQREWSLMEAKLKKSKEVMEDKETKVQALMKILFDLEARGIRIPNIQKYR